MIPHIIREAFMTWVTDPRPMGSFVTALLDNDLVEAFTKADCMNQMCMLEIVRWMVTHMPIASYGSPEKVKAWKGLPKDHIQIWIDKVIKDEK